LENSCPIKLAIQEHLIQPNEDIFHHKDIITQISREDADQYKENFLSESELIHNVMMNIGACQRAFELEKRYFLDYLNDYWNTKLPSEKKTGIDFNVESIYEEILKVFFAKDFFIQAYEIPFCQIFFIPDSLGFIKQNENYHTTELWKLFNGNDQIASDFYKIQKKSVNKQNFLEPRSTLWERQYPLWNLFYPIEVMKYFPQMLFAFFSKELQNIVTTYSDKLTDVDHFIYLYNDIVKFWEKLDVIDHSFLRNLPGFHEFISGFRRIAISDDRLMIELSLAVVFSAAIESLEEILLEKWHNEIEGYPLNKKMEKFQLKFQPGKQNKNQLPEPKDFLNCPALKNDPEIVQLVDSFCSMTEYLYTRAIDQNHFFSSLSPEQRVADQFPLLEFVRVMKPSITTRLFKFGPMASVIEKYIIDQCFTCIPFIDSKFSLPVILNEVFETHPQDTLQKVLYEKPVWKKGEDIEFSLQVEGRDPRFKLFFLREEHSTNATNEISDIGRLMTSIIPVHETIFDPLKAIYDSQTKVLKRVHPQKIDGTEDVFDMSEDPTFVFEDSSAKFSITAKDHSGISKTVYFKGHPFQLSVLLWMKENNGSLSMEKLNQIFDDYLKKRNMQGIRNRVTIKDIVMSMSHLEPKKGKEVTELFTPCIRKGKKIQSVSFDQKFWDLARDGQQFVLELPQASFLDQLISFHEDILKRKTLKIIKDFIQKELEQSREIQ